MKLELKYLKKNLELSKDATLKQALLEPIRGGNLSKTAWIKRALKPFASFLTFAAKRLETKRAIKNASVTDKKTIPKI